ncbi:zinc finger protein 836-like isoform X2 [Linepithema humile]|uniref:zinc finger protein 836-like isoform X2 n=1 Tax=Linepithema humile TaxID=83485 RepID=UPI00351F0DB7
MARRSKLLNVMAKRCRLCLADSGFMVKLRDEFVEPKLKDLTRCTCIDIEYNKNLPDGVCHICFYKLSMWTEFKELFMQSHKILLEQLEISKAPDNAKRSKIDVSSSEVTNVNTDKVIIDTIYISESEDESILSKISPQKACNIDRRKLNKNVKNGSDKHTENKSFESKRSKLHVRCGKNKRRILALKRWQARKKALYAATQKSVSDSESNDVQSTLVRKTQTNTNVDEEAKKQKRFAKLLKNLETNLANKYTGFGISTPRTRLRNQAMVVLPSEKNNIETKIRYSPEKESLPSLVENNVTANGARKPISQTNNTMFTPKSSKTELVIGKTTFIVTSNLVLQDQQCNQTLNNSKNSESLNGDVNSKENTDIFDAVQLRRVVSPAIFENKDEMKETTKNDIERCLDIRIESHEFTMLKHMQAELSDFIQKEVKQKYLSINEDATKTDCVNNTNSQPKLDQKLKNLIQNAIEKNIEHMTNENDTKCQEFQRVSPEFVKTAVHSSQYQPRVVLERLNLANKVINNALKRAALTSESHSATPRKRLIVPPKKYDDFNTSLELDDFTELEDTKVQKTPRACPRTYKNSTTKQLRRKVILEKRITNNDSIVTTNKDNNAMSLPSRVKKDLKVNEEKIDKNRVEIKNLADIETYVCKICKFRCNSKKNIVAHVRETHIIPSGAKDNDAKEDLANKESDKKDVEVKTSTEPEIYVCQICKFRCNSVKDIETHVRASHITSSEAFDAPQNTNNNTVTLPQDINKNTATLPQNVNKNTATLPQNGNKNTATLPQNVNKNTATLPQEKQKKMRCKKCHEIVDYQCVKAHAFSCKLKMPDLIYVCPICKANFKAKKLFLQHFEAHKPLKSTNKTKNKEINNVDESQIKTAVPAMSQESHTVGLQLPTVSEALQKGYAIQTNRKGICVMPLKKQTNETNVQSTTIDESNIQSDKVTTTDAKSNVAKNIAQKNKEYNCFLCEKIFIDEELLKDHLQQHCDEQSDEERSDKKDPKHKCTICGNILESDKALEEHICKHWFDGEDSNNLNKTSSNNEENNPEDSTSSEDEFHQCSQCWELFDSEILLEMHTRVHVQKVPKAAETQIIYQYQCTLCDDLFDTEKDLEDHINLHNGNAQICQLCDKPFRTLEELQEHVTTHL